MLVTLDAPFDAAAAAFAVDTAVECGQPLIVANVVELLLAPCSIVFGYDRPESDEDMEALKAPAVLAHSLGVRVERLRVRSPHPIDALLELTAERGPGLARLRAGPLESPAAHVPQGRPGGARAGRVSRVVA